ncbi:hypothetical protein RB653_000518 [Dictyostelium firmibasis]|uniref:Uncharacterized protein n=1 Tax=Dictyostelium firmibasis TaxID=79012 RepID=A0AAN7TVC7_9MYCE
MSNNTSNNNNSNNNNNNNNNNNININVDHSYDDVDFNNKDPLFFSSGNEYMYRADEVDEDDLEYEEYDYNEETNNGKKIKKKKEFLIDGFDENSESLVRSKESDSIGYRIRNRLEYMEKGTKIIIFVGLITLTVVLCSIGLYFYAKDHKSPLVNYVHPTPLIVISLDGFRWDYLNRGLTPNIKRLIEDGSYRANFTVPQFPSKTFPNHYSIATGLYPENHGIISNHMYDPTTNTTFDINKASVTDSVWYWGEPIWITSEIHGIKSACYFWPGCSAKIKDRSPTFNKVPFSMDISAKTVFDTVYNWTLLESSERPFLSMAYVHEVDDAGHKYGPDSQQVNDAISYLDTQIGGLIDQLKSSNQYNSTNLIILSDHGMANVPMNQTIYLDDLTNDPLFSTKCYIRDWSPILSIFPIENGLSVDEIYKSLTTTSNPNIIIYKKEDIPKELFFNLNDNKRIAPIIGIVSLGYTLVQNKNSPTTNWELGNHGFNPIYEEMKSIFIGHGPNIKPLSIDDSNLTPFKNIEIYNFISTLLNIKSPAPNNGTSLLTDKLYLK